MMHSRKSNTKQEEKRSDDHVHGKLHSSEQCGTHTDGVVSKKLDNEPKAAESPFCLIAAFKFLSLADGRILALRFTVLLCLMMTAVVVGYFSYTLLRANETTLKNHHYDSIVDQLETYVAELMNRQYEALSLVAAAPRNRCPTTSSWPNCAVNFAYMSSTANSLISITQSRGVGFSPFVRENEVSSFETFVYQFYAQQSVPALGEQYGFKGINARNSSGAMYHMTTPDPRGQNAILVPIVQIAKMEDNLQAYMFNLYSEPIRIANIDYMISCSQERNTDCLAVSDVVHLVQDSAYRPAVLLHYPIRLLDANRTIVGLTSGVINWDTILSFSASDHVNGIWAVLRSERDNVEKYYSFQFKDGDASFVGLGDLHDKRFDYSRRTFVVSPFSGSTNYTLCVYISDSFEDEYYTLGPTIACVISVLVIVVTSFIFVAYDALMNRRARESELVIQTRQQFVRFISHEICTPINTIGLGMKFFAKQIEDMLIDPSLDVLVRLRSMLELVHDVEQSSEAAIVILNDLINYDKLKGGMLQLEVEVLDIMDHMMSTIRPFKVQAQQVDVEILVELVLKDENESKRMHDLLVLGDRVKIGQVMRNLISNALKFTPKGGRVTVTAKWCKQGLPNATTLTLTPKSDETVVAPTRKLESTRSQATMPVETSANVSADNIPLHEPSRHLNRCGSLLITVKDSGVGLSAEQCGHLFREGVQFNANKLQGGGGSGLGLFIAKGMAELHSGTLQGSSEGIGKGCTFTLELPVYEMIVHPAYDHERDAYQRNTIDVEQGVTGHALILSSLNSFAYGPVGSDEGGDEPEPKSTVSDTSSVISINVTGGGLNAADQLLASPTLLESLRACSPAGDKVNMVAQRQKERQDRQERILVVDDSVLACKMVTRLLTAEGYLVESCLDGHSCLSKVLEHFQSDELRPYYTAILLDSDMPGISGVEVAERLRAAGYPWLIVGVTGHVHQEDIDNFVRHGASIVLSKPLDFTRLEKVLQDMA